MSQMSDFKALIDEYESKIMMYKQEIERINDTIELYKVQEAEIFAKKNWRGEDIAAVLTKNGYEPEKDLIEAIITHGDWSGLCEKTRQEEEYLTNEVLSVIEELGIMPSYEKEDF